MYYYYTCNIGEGGLLEMGAIRSGCNLLRLVCKVIMSQFDRTGNSRIIGTGFEFILEYIIDHSIYD